MQCFKSTHGIHPIPQTESSREFLIPESNHKDSSSSATNERRKSYFSHQEYDLDTKSPPVTPRSASYARSIPTSPLSSKTLTPTERRLLRYDAAAKSLEKAAIHYQEEPSAQELKIRALKQAIDMLSARAQEAQIDAKRLRTLLVNRQVDPDIGDFETMQRQRWMDEKWREALELECQTVDRNLRILDITDIDVPSTPISPNKRVQMNLITFYTRSNTRISVRRREMLPDYALRKIVVAHTSAMRLKPRPQVFQDRPRSRSQNRPRSRKRAIHSLSLIQDDNEWNGLHKDEGRAIIYRQSSYRESRLPANPSPIVIPSYAKELMKDFDLAHEKFQLPLRLPAYSGALPSTSSHPKRPIPSPTPSKNSSNRPDITLWDVVNPNTTHRTPERPSPALAKQQQQQKKLRRKASDLSSHGSTHSMSSYQPSSLMMLFSKPANSVLHKRPSERPMKIPPLGSIPEAPAGRALSTRSSLTEMPGTPTPKLAARKLKRRSIFQIGIEKRLDKGKQKEGEPGQEKERERKPSALSLLLSRPKSSIINNRPSQRPSGMKLDSTPAEEPHTTKRISISGPTALKPRPVTRESVQSKRESVQSIIRREAQQELNRETPPRSVVFSVPKTPSRKGVDKIVWDQDESNMSAGGNEDKTPTPSPVKKPGMVKRMSVELFSSGRNSLRTARKSPSKE